MGGHEKRKNSGSRCAEGNWPFAGIACQDTGTGLALGICAAGTFTGSTLIGCAAGTAVTAASMVARATFVFYELASWSAAVKAVINNALSRRDEDAAYFYGLVIGFTGLITQAYFATIEAQN